MIDNISKLINFIFFMYFIFLIIISIVLPFIAQKRFAKVYVKYQSVKIKNKYTGYTFCNYILMHNKIENTLIKANEISGIDYYCFATNIIYLNQNNYYNSSVTAIAISGHEAIHAIQYKNRGFLMKIRKDFIPINRFISYSLFPIFLIFIFTNSYIIYLVLIIAYFSIFIFNLIIFIIEFLASHKLLKIVKNGQLKFSVYEYKRIKKILIYAGSTYFLQTFIYINLFIFFLLNILLAK